MLTLSAPGKIFLAGEYGVLKGLPAFVLNVEPRFELVVTPGNGQLVGIPTGSPAQKLFNASSCAGVNFEFKDPFFGRGGFGASSAQFLLMYFYLTEKKSMELGLMPELDFSRLLSVYHNHSWDGQGIAPSGADLVAQSAGGLCLWQPKLGRIEKFRWEFTDLEFLAVHTGYKLATHEHLKQLTDFQFQDLEDPLLKLENSLRTFNSEEFIHSLQQWSLVLKRMNWVTESTQKLLQIYENDPRVLALKGCGALGADVLLLLTRTQHAETLKQELTQSFAGPILSSKNLSNGIQWTQS